MRKFWRHSGKILICLGILHTAVFAIILSKVIVDILKSGLFNSITPDPAYTARGLAWYGGLWFGGMMILLGCLAHSWIKATKRPLPRYIGWVLAALGLVGAVLEPVSGAPLVLLLGLLVVFARPEDNGAEVK